MFASRFRSSFAVALLAAALVAPAAASAQQVERPSASRQQTAAQAPPQVTVNVNQNADETRREFYEVLQQYPPALGRVLRLDPTLMTNEAYMASYPTVAAFIAQNPDVPRNPGYYLERYGPHFEPIAGLSPDGRVEKVSVYDTSGQVRYDDDVVFLADFPEGWKVTAAGCVPQPDAPYDCKVQGG